MEKIILEAFPGDTVSAVAEKAKKMVGEQDIIVQFTFNGIDCLVNKNTVVEYLVKHYMDSHIMDWKEVGPDYPWRYDADTEIELCRRKLQRAEERKVQEEEQKKKDDAEKDAVDALTKGIEASIIEDKKEKYAEYVATNSKDGYSRCVVDYGEAWMKLMQVEIAKGRTVVEVAEETQKPLSYLGITGFMYGCAVRALSEFWVHGEELRKWHNKEYGHEGAGVVNPAVLTISTTS